MANKLDQWEMTQELVRDLIASGQNNDSNAYRQLMAGIKRATGSRKILTLSPLDYADKTVGGHNVRQELYDLSAKFNRSLTRTIEGIEQAREDAYNRAIEMGIPEDKIDDFFKLISKAREMIDDKVFTANSDAIVDTIREVLDPSMTVTNEDGVEMLLNPRPIEYSKGMKLGERDATTRDYTQFIKGIQKLIKDDATYEEFLEFGRSIGYKFD